MRNELTELIKSISEEEFEKFGDFIKSPYFNKQPRFIKLYEFIRNNFEEISEEKISNPDVSEYMYPGEKLKNESIRKLFSDLNKLFEKFIVQASFESNEQNYNIVYLEELLKRGKVDKFWKQHSLITRKHTESQLDMDEYYKTGYTLKDMEFTQRLEEEFFLKYNGQIYQEKNDAINYEFISKKLTFIIRHLKSNHYFQINRKNKNTFLPEIEDFITRNKKEILNNHPYIHIKYLQVQHHLSNFNESAMHEFKKVLDKNKFYLQKNPHPYFTYIRECFWQIYVGRPEYHKDRLNYFKLLDSTDLLFTKKFPGNGIFFYHAVSSAWYSKDIKWMEYFISKYKNRFTDAYKDNLINHSYSVLYFELKDFEAAKKIISKIKFIRFFDYFDAKEMLLRIHYEQNNLSDLFLEIENIKKYLKNHPEAIHIPAHVKNFTIFISKLSRVKEKIERGKNMDYDLEKIRKELIPFEKIDFFEKRWMLEKIQEMIN